MNQIGQKIAFVGRESDTIWMAKAVAVAFTICAHCNTVLENAPFAAKVASCFLASLGSLGVPVFFYLSGYLFSYKKFAKCAKTKIRTLIIPWIFCGSLVYLYIYLRKGQISFLTYFKWILGVDTYLWYLSISVVLILLGESICWLSSRTKIAIQYIALICIFLSLIVLFMENIKVLSFHPYLDIFRWQWIFVFGMIDRQKHFIKYLPATRIPFVLGMIVLLLLALTGSAVSYWSRYWAFAAVLAVISVVMLCKSCKDGNFHTIDIGKRSFSIYLLHMPIAGIVANLFNRFNDTTGMMTLFRPVIVLIITFLLLKLVERMIGNKKIEQEVRQVLGIR